MSSRCPAAVAAIFAIAAAHGAAGTEAGEPGGPRRARRALRRADVAIVGRPSKVCQLVGDFDRERQTDTLNLTKTRWGVAGTDLGVSFRHAGKRWFLFGDTTGVVPGARDSFASSDDDEPDDCLALDFVADGGVFRPLTIPGISQAAFNVPIAGLGAGGSMYVYHSTDSYLRPDGTQAMGRTVLARSDDQGRTFTRLYDLSTALFINVSAVVVAGDAVLGLPWAPGQTLLLFGSGDYRKSDVRLAAQPLDEIGDRDSLRYLGGVDGLGLPFWSSAEGEAVPLFDDPCVGELSVSWNAALERFVMLYNCGGIILRTAPRPWGPWSPPQTLFDGWSDGGYCHFMHVSWAHQQCDEVHDAGRENVWGGAYGPYQIDDLATAGSATSTIYFTMSTWNPYTILLMRATLAR